MIIDLRVPGIRYEIDALCRMLYWDEPVRIFEDGSPGAESAGEDLLRMEAAPLPGGERSCRLTCFFHGAVCREEFTARGDRNSLERAFCRSLYETVTRRKGRTLPWGLLTGVRPVGLIRRAIAAGETEDAISDRLRDVCRVSSERRALAFDTCHEQEDLLARPDPAGICLYLAVPFCPSRCSYCSYVSHSVEKARSLVPEYVAAMVREIRAAGELLRKTGAKTEAIYMGGGTPTSLSAGDLDRILSALDDSVDRTNLREFSVEAGRPDTITGEKLEVLLRHRVGRISVNPQTLSEEVLRGIGRKHTVREFFDAFALASGYPFLINVDLIAGLPGDSFSSFRTSLEGVLSLRPANLTVHALTVKRASALKREGVPRTDALPMVDFSRRRLTDAGYRPYYLYRQKGTVEALENVGYAASSGARCYYNAAVMDDSVSVLSVGAGGVTKLVPRDGGPVRRFCHFKYPYEYLARFDRALALQEETARTLASFRRTEDPDARGKRRAGF